MTYNIAGSSNVTIVGGDNSNSPIVVTNTSLDIDLIRELLNQINEVRHSFDLTTRNLIDAIKTELQAELAKPNVNPVRTRSFLNSIRAVAEGAAGNLAANGIVQMISKLLD